MSLLLLIDKEMSCGFDDVILNLMPNRKIILKDFTLILPSDSRLKMFGTPITAQFPLARAMLSGRHHRNT